MKQKLQNLLRVSDKDKQTLQKLNFRAPSVWLATWFGCGFMRPAPGTWGSLGAIPPALLLILLGQPAYLIPAILLITALGFWSADRFEKMTGDHDSKMIVIDEVAGQWIAMLPVIMVSTINPVLLIVSFVLFRIFDIIKPWPVSFFDRKVPGAAGVMGDDIAAGAIAAFIIGGIQYAGFG